MNNSYSELKTSLTPDKLVSIHHLQDLIHLPKKYLLKTIVSRPDPVTIYVAERIHKRKGETTILNELFILATDAKKIFNLNL